MKIRNHRKREYWFYPSDDSNLEKKSAYRFKYKSSLMKFLNKNLIDAVNGTVTIDENSFGSSGAVREYSVWYNRYDFENKGHELKVVLKQSDFRGRKYIFKPSKISKESKKYFAFSNKVISLMCNIQDDNGNILEKDAIRLVELFKKRGFKDFEPDEDGWNYINGNISEGIPFYYWSDRCNWLRTKAVIESFKRSGLIDKI